MVARAASPGGRIPSTNTGPAFAEGIFPFIAMKGKESYVGLCVKNRLCRNATERYATCMAVG